MQNVVFIKNNDEIRPKLFELGLELYSVHINSESYLMVVTNQLKLMKQLAKNYGCGKLYISDSRRETFRLDLRGGKFYPTKLGNLKRSPVTQAGVSSSGTFFLIVTENNTEYHYSCEQ